MCNHEQATGSSCATNSLRAARLAAGLTQAQLAQKAKIGERAISAIERGQGRARRPTRRAILCALGLPQSEHLRVFGPLPVYPHEKRAR